MLDLRGDNSSKKIVKLLVVAFADRVLISCYFVKSGIEIEMLEMFLFSSATEVHYRSI